MRYIKKILFNKRMIIGIAVLLQLLFLMEMLVFLNDYSTVFYVLSISISIICLLVIVYDDFNPAFKIAWIIPIVLMPIFGGVFYLFFGGSQLTSKEKKRMIQIEEDTIKMLGKNDAILNTIEDVHVRRQAKYLQDYAPYPIYKNTTSKYFPIGEENFIALKAELSKAKKYIFMEYFIIEKGKMWDEILEILKEKVKNGVDVRLIYDDVGCMLKLPNNYHKTLRNYGIKCEIFNPLKPILSFRFNTRNHRKITVIDGHTAFTGGINLADEYINEVEVFGHWKDMGIMIKGDAVWNFTVMFLSLWKYVTKEEVDYKSFHASKVINECNGYVLPYSDNPLDKESVGENVYINMINKAKEYIYITSPYLIIGSELITALTNAAKSGVDVRIITPHIPDKWYVHFVSRSYYNQLIKSGIKIYEYEPGFMHGKNFISDDELGIVGTINMDYRSLYHHFECAVWLYKTITIKDIKEDFLKTQEKCIEITEQKLKRIGIFKILLGLLLRVFAPLM